MRSVTSKILLPPPIGPSPSESRDTSCRWTSTANCFSNPSQKIQTIESDPPGAITTEEGQPTKSGWKLFTLRGKSWGRARLAITYADGTKQSVSYYITKPASQAVADLGHFLFTKQWFVDDNDPFHRSPSVMSYNRAADKW